MFIHAHHIFWYTSQVRIHTDTNTRTHTHLRTSKHSQEYTHTSGKNYKTQIHPCKQNKNKKVSRHRFELFGARVDRSIKGGGNSKPQQEKEGMRKWWATREKDPEVEEQCRMEHAVALERTKKENRIPLLLFHLERCCHLTTAERETWSHGKAPCGSYPSSCNKAPRE